MIKWLFWLAFLIIMYRPSTWLTLNKILFFRENLFFLMMVENVTYISYFIAFLFAILLHFTVYVSFSLIRLCRMFSKKKIYFSLVLMWLRFENFIDIKFFVIEIWKFTISVLKVSDIKIQLSSNVSLKADK